MGESDPFEELHAAFTCVLHGQPLTPMGVSHCRAALDRIQAELERLREWQAEVSRLPELDWARAGARIMQAAASAARAGYQADAKEMVAALDAGKVYVSRLLQDRTAFAERVRDACASAAWNNEPDGRIATLIRALDLAPLVDPK